MERMEFVAARTRRGSAGRPDRGTGRPSAGLGFGISTGLGAAAGLTTAVVAGAVAAVFGGSRFQVSGPTGAMTVVLVPIVHEYGGSGVLAVGLIAGIVLVVLAFAGVGRAVRFMPAPVIEGFTAGIAVVIALQQIPAALGITDAEGDKVWRSAADAVAKFVAHPSILTPATALAVAVAILVGGRYFPQGSVLARRRGCRDVGRATAAPRHRPHR